MIQKLSKAGTRSYYKKCEAHGLPITIACFPRSEVEDFSVVMCTQPKLSPEKMLRTFDRTPEFLSNGSFFDAATGDSIFHVISGGVEYSSEKYVGNDTGFGVVHGQSESGPVLGDYQTGTLLWRDFLTAYPLLVDYNERTDVSAYPDINYAAQRLVFGMLRRGGDDELWYFFLLVEGSGCKLEVLQDILFEEVSGDGDYICWSANLDGGGSAYLAIEGQRVSEVAQGSWQRAVDNVIAVYLKDGLEPEPEPEEPKQYWRVSLGAFSVKENAYRYLNTIRSLGVGVVDYSKAFVSYDSDRKLYRVQVGAFSKREGAEKVAAELASWGYDTYVRYGA